MDYQFLDDGIFALRGFLTAEECADHLRDSEHLGYADATIQGVRGAVLRKDVRNHEHILVDNIVANDPKRTFCLLRLAQFSKSLRTA